MASGHGLRSTDAATAAIVPSADATAIRAAANRDRVSLGR